MTHNRGESEWGHRVMAMGMAELLFLIVDREPELRDNMDHKGDARRVASGVSP